MGHVLELINEKCGHNPHGMEETGTDNKGGRSRGVDLVGIYSLSDSES